MLSWAKVRFELIEFEFNHSFLSRTEPASAATSPRLSAVFDQDSRKLILARVGASDTPTHSMDHEDVASAPSRNKQSTRFLQTPSPTSNTFPHSGISLTPPSSRPATSMSATSNHSSRQTEGIYDRYLMTQSNVVRNGKGYQSDFSLRGKGIEHIPSNSNLHGTANPKRGSMFNRLAPTNNPVPERSNTVARVANAFKTIVSGGSKKREQVSGGTPIVVGGGFGSSMDAPRANTMTSRHARTWSRAYAG
jgi:hypothetical protein